MKLSFNVFVSNSQCSLYWDPRGGHNTRGVSGEQSSGLESEPAATVLMQPRIQLAFWAAVWVLSSSFRAQVKWCALSKAGLMSAAKIWKTLCGAVWWCRDLTGNLVLITEEL